MAAENTSGNKTLDSYRTGELCINAMNLAKKILILETVFFCLKYLWDQYLKKLTKKRKKCFKRVVIYKPLSSKKESKEIYIFCKGILKI